MKHGKPTQRGNPHQLTINQHILPKASIERFAGHDRSVDCCLLPNGNIQRLRPDNSLFCASRAWNQHAENGPTTKRVEAEFRELATTIESGQMPILDTAAHLTATKFFALVVARERVRNESPVDVAMPDRNSQNLILDQQEWLEKSGYMFVRDGGIMEC